jgi:AcrR family transcriptional regulator
MSADSNNNLVLSPKLRRERNRQEMRKAILEAARAVMREEGVAALNLNEVARRVGLRTPSLYEYFANKMAIYDALFLQGITLYSEFIQKSQTNQPTFWQALESFFTNSLSFAWTYQELYSLAFERPVPGFEPSEASMEESRQLLASSDKFVEEAITSGEIETGLTVRQTMDLLIIATYGLAAQHLANHPQLPPGEGRFGSLVEPLVNLFKAAWTPKTRHRIEQESNE